MGSRRIFLLALLFLWSRVSSSFVVPQPRISHHHQESSVLLLANDYLTLSKATKLTRCFLFSKEGDDELGEEEDVAKSSSPASYYSAGPSFSRRAWFQATIGASAAALVASTLQPSPAWAVASPITSGPVVCDPSVSVWRRGNRIVYLQGTAHISETSAQLAGDLVRQTHPNAVFVELDLRRLGGAGSIPGGPQAMAVKPGEMTTSRLILDPVDPETSGPSRIVIPRVNLEATLRSSRDGGMLLSSANPEDGSGSSGGGAVDVVASPSSSTALTATTVSMEPDVDAAPKPRGGFLAGIKQSVVNAGAAAIGGAIRGMYQNLGQAGFNPGEEFATALRTGQEMGADLVMGDRDVKITLQRLTQALAVTDLDALLNPDSELERSMKELMGDAAPETDPMRMLGSSGKGGDVITKEQFKAEMTRYVETLKSRETVRTLMEQLNTVAPELVKVMLTERDAYMAAGLDTLNEYEVITAVFGMAHQDGIERNLKQMGWKQVPLNCPRMKM